MAWVRSVEVRHALGRTLTCLGPLAVYVPASLLTGGPPEAMAFVVAGLSAAVVGSLSWVEARGMTRQGRHDREIVLLCLGAPVLVTLALLQGLYADLLLRHSVRGGLMRWQHRVSDGAFWDALAIPIANLSLALVGASWRRMAALPLWRVGPWALVAVVVTCGVLARAFVVWLVIEVVYALADWLVQTWERRRRARGDDGVRALEELGLPFGRLWLLAYLGHPPAVELLGPRAPAAPVDLPEWLQRLDGAGAEAIRAAARAVARRAVREWNPPPGWEAAREAVNAWVASPSDETAARAAELLEGVPLPAPDPTSRAFHDLGRAIGVNAFGRGAALARALPVLGTAEEIREEVAAELIDWAQSSPNVRA